MHRTALLIINRRSRRGAKKAKLAVEFLRELHVRVIEKVARHSSEISGIVREHGDDADVVVIGGGDGTINAALAEFVESPRTLGMLPLGTANNFARTVGIPLDLKGACELIVHGKAAMVDVGKVNDRYFLTTASIGLSVRATHELSRESKRRWGRLAYVGAMVRAVRDFDPFEAELILPGRRLRTRTVQIVVGNGLYYGTKLRVAEDAQIDDNRLDVLSVEATGLWQLLKIFPSLKIGDHEKRDDVLTLRTSELRIETSWPRKIDIDGELAASTPATFRVLPGALRVIAAMNGMETRT